MIFYPDEYFKNILEIDYEFLYKNKIKGIILDVDNTLVDFNENLLEGTKEWCENLKQKGIKFYIVSNSNKKPKVETLAKTLGTKYILFAKKPFKGAFKKVAAELGLPLENIAAVGDQVFTDVVAANRCKMFSILVHPLDEKDIWLTIIKRPFENYILKKYFEKQKGEKK